MVTTTPRVGERMPNVTLPLVGGGTVRLPTDYLGRRLLIFMWASW